MDIRSKFSLSPDRSTVLLKQSVVKKVEGCMVLSTCNRSEIYGICNDPGELAALFCSNTNNKIQDFLSHAYIYRGIPAIEHLFKVASGLDSQIIGDYEILSQLKLSAKMAKEQGSFNSFLERAVNYALQVSKEIKTKTKLSSGTVSVSYAAIEIIKEKIVDLSDKNILIIGTGKFGNHIAKNIHDYLPGAGIFFINRTDKKAVEMAATYNAGFIPYTNLKTACDNADVIIVSSASGSWSVFPSFFSKNKSRLILDLSVPQNVHPSVKDLDGITVLNVDEVSKILDKTISIRQAEVPKALLIINETLSSLEEWHRNQFNNPLLRMVKGQLFQLNEVYSKEKMNEEKIHKTVSSLALKLKIENNKGCQCINALSNYLHETTT